MVMLKRLGLPPQGLFPGKNIMTPNIIGYVQLRRGWAELSEGRGMSQQPIFGVTVRPDANDPKERRSKLCGSREEAEEYIRSME